MYRKGQLVAGSIHPHFKHPCRPVAVGRKRDEAQFSHRCLVETMNAETFLVAAHRHEGRPFPIVFTGEVVIAQTDQGRGILGVIDGSSPKGVETEADIQARKEFLRKIGYKL